MSRKNHIDGKKVGRHTTLIDASEKVIKAIQKSGYKIDKISAGWIKKTKRAGSCRVKVAETENGLKLTVRGSIFVQELHIKVRPRIRRRLKKFLQQEYG